MDALRIRNFWPYFIGNLVSNCGTWFHNIAVALLIYRLTGSTFLVGLVNFAQFIGTFAVARPVRRAVPLQRANRGAHPRPAPQVGGGQAAAVLRVGGPRPPRDPPR